jgi:cyclopropane fatty-acyl-phospholipid synthase-like methyltransferase
MMNKPFSPACERNKAPILERLNALITGPARVLEIGSGTGQHAAHFAAQRPDLDWQCSDVAENLPGIRCWVEDAGLANLPAAIHLDVLSGDWPEQRFDAVFSANTSHIMSWPAVRAMFAGLEGVLSDQGLFLLYGPFNYAGVFSSEGNRQLDAWARETFDGAGIRNFEAICEMAAELELNFQADHPMPANNRLLVFRRP